MPNLFYEIWENMVARTRGPLNFRFVFEPVLSVLFAIRTGLRDAKKRCPPSLLRLLVTRKQRKILLQESRRDLGNILVFSMLLDIVYQLVVVYILRGADSFLPFESVFVALLLTVLPYLLIRGPVNRLIRKFYAIKRKNKSLNENSQHPG